VGVAWVTWPNSALKGRIAYLPADVTSKVNDMFINKSKTANIKGKN